MGKTDEWIEPVTGPANAPFTAMDLLFVAHGYRRLPTLDYRHKQGKSKVALYAIRNPDGTVAEVTHAALQADDGTWTSKIGQGPLIRHSTPNSLSGPAYGEPVAVYQR